MFFVCVCVVCGCVCVFLFPKDPKKEVGMKAVFWCLVLAIGDFVGSLLQGFDTKRVFLKFLSVIINKSITKMTDSR